MTYRHKKEDITNVTPSRIIPINNSYIMANSLIKALFMSNLSIYILSLFKILPECGIFYPVLLSTLAWLAKQVRVSLLWNQSVGREISFLQQVDYSTEVGR